MYEQREQSRQQFESDFQQRKVETQDVKRQYQYRQQQMTQQQTQGLLLGLTSSSSSSTTPPTTPATLAPLILPPRPQAPPDLNLRSDRVYDCQVNIETRLSDYVRYVKAQAQNQDPKKLLLLTNASDANIV